MRIKTVFLSLFLALLLCSCSAATEAADVTEVFNKDGKPLVLFFVGNGKMENQPYYKMAQEFMKEHKVAEIEFSYVDTSLQKGFTMNELKKQISGQNGGNGADLIAMNSFLNAESLHGIELAEMNEMMAGDESFARSDYFENILDAMSDDGKMYVMPISLDFQYISLNRKYEDLLDKPFAEYTSVNFKQMLDIYDIAVRLNEGGSKPLLTDRPLGNEGVYRALDLSGIDTDIIGVYTVQPENAELLRRWLEIPDMSSEFYYKVMTGSDSMEQVERIFGNYFSNLGVGWSAFLLGYPDSGYTQPAAIAGLDGMIPFKYYSALTINEKCGDKELAWEFVKFCMDNKPVQTGDARDVYLFSQSINKESFMAATVSFLSDGYDENANRGYFPAKGKSDAVMDAAEFLMGIAEQCSRFDLTLGSGLGDYSKVLREYRAGKITFEATVKRIEEIVQEIIN